MSMFDEIDRKQSEENQSKAHPGLPKHVDGFMNVEDSKLIFIFAKLG